MLTLDTSGLVALISRADPYHEETVAVVKNDPGPYIIPAGILAEIAYILESRAGLQPVFAVLQDIQTGAYTLHCGDQDLARIRDLMRRYRDLSLGFADAAVIACAECHAGSVITTDRRHFPVVARGEGTITVLPEY